MVMNLLIVTVWTNINILKQYTTQLLSSLYKHNWFKILLDVQGYKYSTQVELIVILLHFSFILTVRVKPKKSYKLYFWRR